MEWEKIQGGIPLHKMYILVVEIARGKFMEAEGDSERPDGIEYL